MKNSLDNQTKYLVNKITPRITSFFLLLMFFAIVKPCSYNQSLFFLIFGLKQFGRSASCLGNIVKPSTDGTSHTDKYKNMHLGSKQWLVNSQCLINAMKWMAKNFTCQSGWLVTHTLILKKKKPAKSLPENITFCLVKIQSHSQIKN